MNTLTHTCSLQTTQSRNFEISLRSILTVYAVSAFISILAGFVA